jgi:hypothetical protein
MQDESAARAEESPKRCEDCGALLERRRPSSPADAQPTAEADGDREYDHRGILLPKRTRVGGIIVPQ